MKLHINHLAISWSVSRGRDTYGYNICRLDDRQQGKRYRCNGGGYDMIGTVFGEWLADYYQDQLRIIANRAHNVYVISADGDYSRQKLAEGSDPLYGMTAYYCRVWAPNNLQKVTLDGACGIDCMIRIAEAIGLTVEREYNKKGHTTGYYVSRPVYELEAA